MEISKMVSMVALLLFLVSCGPAKIVTTSTPTLSPQPTATQVVQVKPWPGLDDGWTTYQSTTTYLSIPIYDPEGYLWALSGNSAYRWTVETGQFSEFTSKDGLPQNLGNITFFNKKIWVGTNRGEVAFYSNGKWATQTVVKGETSALSSTGDRLWLAGKDGMYFFDGQEWKPFEPFPKELRDSYTRVARSKDGSLWFWNYNHMLRLSGNSWREYPNLVSPQTVFTLSDGTLLFKYDSLIMSFDGQALRPLILPGDQYRYTIRYALLAPEGDLWLQVYDYHTEAAAERYPTYLIHNGRVNKVPTKMFERPPDPSIYTPVAVVPEGWVFTTAGSLYLYDEKDWKKYSIEGSALEHTMNNSVIGFAPDGALWTKQAGLPVRFDGRTVESVFEKDNTCDSSYKSLIAPNGSIWGGGYMADYLCYYDVEAKTISRFDLFFRMVDFAVAPDGSLWASSRSGFIAHLTLDALRSGDYRKIELVKIGGDAIRYNLVPQRIEVSPDGAVWVFAKGAGLYRYDGEDWKYYGMSELKDQTAFAIDSKGHVWVGFCGELMMHDGDKWSMYPKNCINPSDMIIARDGAVWFIDVCDGVYRFDGAEWSHFTNEQLGGFHPERILIAPDGALWFVSYQKWARYKP